MKQHNVTPDWGPVNCYDEWRPVEARVFAEVKMLGQVLWLTSSDCPNSMLWRLQVYIEKCYT